MRKKDFIGKTINVSKLQEVADNFIFAVVEEDGNEHMWTFYYDDNPEYTNAEIILYDWHCNDCYDNSGYNAYSLKVIVDGDKIIKLIRIGHCHMCGNEGSDDELMRFPYHSLEAEATGYMIHCCDTVNRENDNAK